MNKLEREKKKFDFQMLILLNIDYTNKSLISHDYEFWGPK